MNYMNYLTVVFTKNKGIDAPEAKDIQKVPEIRQTSGYAKKVTSEDDIVFGVRLIGISMSFAFNGSDRDF